MNERRPTIPLTTDEIMALGLIEAASTGGNGLNTQLAEKILERLPSDNTLKQVLLDKLQEQNNGR